MNINFKKNMLSNIIENIESKNEIQSLKNDIKFYYKELSKINSPEVNDNIDFAMKIIEMIAFKNNFRGELENIKEQDDLNNLLD